MSIKGPFISWDADPTHTDKLVSWILNHPADHHILFHDCLSNTSQLNVSDKPSGKNKKDVSAVIAKHIFEHDHIYAALYQSDPNRFATSVINRLTT